MLFETFIGPTGKELRDLMSTTTSDSVAEPTFGAPNARHVDLILKLHRRNVAESAVAPGADRRDRGAPVEGIKTSSSVLMLAAEPFLCASSSSTSSPKIGQGIGAASGIPGAESAFATVLVPGVVGLSIMFQENQAVAMQLAQEFGFTHEIEDRVQAPCPIWLVAISKVISGGAQGLISAAIVLPIA